jgi:group I intron endonuclease
MKIGQPRVYCFWNKINNKVYVGSAQDLEVRINQHLKSKSSGPHLQSAIKKYGIAAFHISQVTTGTHTDALNLEQMCLDYLFGRDKLKYNLADKVGGGCIGSKENHRELSLKGRTKAEYRELCLRGALLLSVASITLAANVLKVSRANLATSLNNKTKIRRKVYSQSLCQSVVVSFDKNKKAVKVKSFAIKPLTNKKVECFCAQSELLLAKYNSCKETGKLLGIAPLVFLRI